MSAPNTNIADARFDTLKIERSNDAVTVCLNRPNARNAMSMQMCHDVIATFAAMRFDAGIRLVLVRGAGPVFCSGIDLKEMKGQSRNWMLKRRNLGLDAFMAIETCAAPVVAIVQGAVVGAGCEIMAACDFTLAAENTRFQWPEVVWGAVGATQRLPRSCSHRSQRSTSCMCPIRARPKSAPRSSPAMRRCSSTARLLRCRS